MPPLPLGLRPALRLPGLALLLVPLLLVSACKQLRLPREDIPFTPLSLADPVGAGTRGKLVALTRDPAQCRTLLDAAGVRFTPLPPVTRTAGGYGSAGGNDNACGYDDGVALKTGGALPIAFRPGGLGVACPVAAALALWQRDVVAPAAQRHFGRAVTGIDHYGSFSCRRINGREDGNWSEHATADAIDIAGFRLAGGEQVTVRRDWHGTPDRAAFLRDVRDGGCRLFATALSPDYNAAHADHLHFAMADRGGWGGGFCR